MPNTAPRPSLTHFLAIPLYTSLSAPQLAASLSNFTALVARPSSDRSAPYTGNTVPGQSLEDASPPSSSAGTGNSSSPTMTLHPKAIRPASTMHLTLGVMSLTSPGRVQDAISFLKSLDLAVMLASAATVASTADVSSTTFALNRSLDQSTTSASTVERGERAGRAALLPSEQNLPRSESLLSSLSPEETVPSLPSVSDTKNKGSGNGNSSQQPESTGGSTSPITITLRGLTPMQSMQATTSLYATPDDPSGRLWPLCNALRKEFVEAGFLISEDRELKLHASVVNTVYVPRGRAKAGAGARGKGRPKRLTIEASGLVERWRGEVWADRVEIEGFVIYKMGAKVDEEGLERYEVVGAVQMP